MRFAFFDLDNTLIKPVSLISFFSYLVQRELVNEVQIAQFEQLKHNKQSGVSREVLNRQYYEIYQGMDWHELLTLGQAWFNSVLESDFYYQKMKDVVRKHQQKGHATCIVSGSFLPCIAPIQHDLGIEHVLCSELEVIDGHVTGRLLQQVIGDGKGDVMHNFALKNNINLAQSYGYADDISDRTMLEKVGCPVAVISQQNPLIQYASKQNWHRIELIA